MRSLVALVLVGLALISLIPAASGQGDVVLVAAVEGDITRATVEYVKAAIADAEARDARAIVFRFSTPGGGFQETRQIQAAFLHTVIPVIGWVAPSGARAEGAGAVLLLSTDLAAMAPSTRIGSMQPASFTGNAVTDPTVVGMFSDEVGEQLDLHARNASLAEAFVGRNVEMDANEALDAGAIELVAGTLDELIDAANGFDLPTSLLARAPQKRTPIDTSDVRKATFEAPAGVALFAPLANPILSGLLVLLGIYVIILGIPAPGRVIELSGVAMVAVGVLGLGFAVSPPGLVSLALGAVLLLAEAFGRGFRVLGGVGVLCVVLAAAFLAPVAPPDYLLAPGSQQATLAGYLAPTAILGVLLLFAFRKVQRMREAKAERGKPVGAEAVTLDPISPGGKGYVMFRGERWLATSDEDLPAKESVLIAAKEGIVLRVKRKPPEAPAVAEAEAPPGEEPGKPPEAT